MTHKSGLVASRAARRLVELERQEWGREVREAFAHWLDRRPSDDPGCEARVELARALCEWEEPAPELFLRGTRWVQMEAGLEVAGSLRGLCAVGLVRTRSEFGLERAADLLADPKEPARVLAAQAVSESGSVAAAALLRLRLLTGEADTAVILECLTGLFALTPQRALEFVKEYYLASPGSAGWSAAVLAVGESRLPEALAVLIELYPQTVRGPDRRAVLEAMAMLRSAEALEFLLERVERESEAQSRLARQVVEKFWTDEATLARLEGVVR